MTPDSLPSPYELARLAAAIRGRKVGENPTEASKQALALWIAAADELRDEDARRGAAETERWKGQQSAIKPDDKTILLKTKARKSPAMEWLNSNAKQTREKFKTIRAFYAAWVRFEPADLLPLQKHIEGELSTTYGELRRFEMKRIEERHATDAKRQERNRGKIRASKMESNKIAKIPAGHSLKVKRKMR